MALHRHPAGSAPPHAECNGSLHPQRAPRRATSGLPGHALDGHDAPMEAPQRRGRSCRQCPAKRSGRRPEPRICPRSGTWRRSHSGQRLGCRLRRPPSAHQHPAPRIQDIHRRCSQMRRRSRTHSTECRSRLDWPRGRPIRNPEAGRAGQQDQATTFALPVYILPAPGRASREGPGGTPRWISAVVNPRPPCGRGGRLRGGSGAPEAEDDADGLEDDQQVKID